MNEADPELLSCLQGLVSPPETQCSFLRGVEPLAAPLRGAVVVGDPGPGWWRVLHGALLPGAHVALVPACAVGDRAACAAEDAGLEVRDAVYVATGAQDLIFSPKASRREKEEGLEGLPAMPGYQAVKRKQGSAGLKYARAGAGRTAKEVRNHHPTAKPVAVMAELLGKLGVGAGPVLDPFAGSGSTAVACAREGVSSLSIEKDPGYARIGRAKVAHEAKKSQAALPALGPGGPVWQPGGRIIYLLRKPPEESTRAGLLSSGTGALNLSPLRPARAASWPPNVVLRHGEGCAEGCGRGCPVRALAEKRGREAPARFKVIGARGEERSPWRS